MPSDVIINKPLSKQTMYIIGGSVIVVVIVLIGVVIFLITKKPSTTSPLGQTTKTPIATTRISPTQSPIATTRIPPTQTPTCTDDNASCASWAAVGECTRNPAYMRVTCKKSCNICNPGTPPETPTGTPPGTTPETTKGAPTKPEVYYYDDAGDVNNRYKMTFETAKERARISYGVIATPEQLRDAWSAGLDVCRIGWASDGNKYISSNSFWGNACITTELIKGNWSGGAGVWIYGIKPHKLFTRYCDNIFPCTMPFSKQKWSQYD